MFEVAVGTRAVSSSCQWNERWWEKCRGAITKNLKTEACRNIISSTSWCYQNQVCKYERLQQRDGN